MRLHLAAILPVCKTFNPFLKQTIAQPKDWKLRFPVLASALGNLGKLWFIFTVHWSRKTPGSPSRTWWSRCRVMPPELSHVCDTFVALQGEATACSGGRHRTFTASWVGSSLQNEFVSDISLQEFSPEQPHSPGEPLRRISGFFSLPECCQRQSSASDGGLIAAWMGNWLDQSEFKNNLP